RVDRARRHPAALPVGDDAAVHAWWAQPGPDASAGALRVRPQPSASLRGRDGDRGSPPEPAARGLPAPAGRGAHPDHLPADRDLALARALRRALLRARARWRPRPVRARGAHRREGAGPHGPPRSPRVEAPRDRYLRSRGQARRDLDRDLREGRPLSHRGLGGDVAEDGRRGGLPVRPALRDRLVVLALFAGYVAALFFTEPD